MAPSEQCRRVHCTIVLFPSYVLRRSEVTHRVAVNTGNAHTEVSDPLAVLRARNVIASSNSWRFVYCDQNTNLNGISQQTTERSEKLSSMDFNIFSLHTT
jgi:hypothetical protein